jgi:hypothetical protein
MDRDSKRSNGEEFEMCFCIKVFLGAVRNNGMESAKSNYAHAMREGYKDIDEDRAWKVWGMFAQTATDPASFRGAVLSYLRPDAKLRMVSEIVSVPCTRNGK